MSSGSRFMLFRKHALSMSDAEFAKVVEHYKKSAVDMEDDELPEIAGICPFEQTGTYDEKKKVWIQKEDGPWMIQKEFRYVTKKDHKLCDLLLEWSFGSGFDCLKQEWNLSPYKFKYSQKVISKDEAEKMLVAVSYLLNGDWSASTEKAIGDKYLTLFTDGYSSDSYHKYLDRNRPNRHEQVIRHCCAGYEIIVKTPHIANSDNSDDIYEREIREADDTIEFWLQQTKYALEAYLKAEDFSYENKHELVLVYEAT